jgi:hypothetical protein
VLPHVGTEEHCETRKAFFLGYTVHKMLMCTLGRAEEDDRDHYGALLFVVDSFTEYKRRLTPTTFNKSKIAQARSGWTWQGC